MRCFLASRLLSHMRQCRNIYLKVKKAGGMKITFQSPPKSLDEKMLYNILRDYKMLNCEVLVRDENGRSTCAWPHDGEAHGLSATVDDFIDVIMKDHRKYIKWYLPEREGDCKCWRANRKYSLYVYNKIDSVSLDFLDQLAREPDTVVMSCELDLGIQDVVERCWHELQLLRIYTKRFVCLYCQCPFLANSPSGRGWSPTLAKH